MKKLSGDCPGGSGLSVGSCVMACVLVAVATFGGCGSSATDCTTVAIPSVIVTVLADDGGEVENPRVQFRREGSGESFEDCYLNVPSDDPAAPTFTCGYEVRGDLEIRAEDGEGRVGEVTVRVSGDECHVDTREIAITIE